ncbi:MAG: hypothetical protein ACK4NP_01100 [Parvularculaceae bacterium]
MLLTPVAVSLFAFLALVAGTTLFFVIERRFAAAEKRLDPSA